MDIKKVPYDYKPFTFKIYKSLDREVKGYNVRLYFVFDGKHTHQFLSESDMLDNALLCKECGVHCTMFYQQITVTPSDFPDIYNEIQDYEDYVSCSRSD